MEALLAISLTDKKVSLSANINKISKALSSVFDPFISLPPTNLRMIMNYVNPKSPIGCENIGTSIYNLFTKIYQVSKSYRLYESFANFFKTSKLKDTYLSLIYYSHKEGLKKISIVIVEYKK